MSLPRDYIGHFYEPIPFFGGRVMKYRGIACSSNVEWMMRTDGMVLVSDFLGDRIPRDMAHHNIIKTAVTE